MTANTLTILGFLAMLAVTLLGGARIAIWIYSGNERTNRIIRDGLVCHEADAAADDDDWDDIRRDEWWRR